MIGVVGIDEVMYVSIREMFIMLVIQCDLTLSSI